MSVIRTAFPHLFEQVLQMSFESGPASFLIWRAVATDPLLLGNRIPF